MKAVIATKNQGKIAGAKQALQTYFQTVEIIGIPVESDVSEQPVNNQIYKGAYNRIQNLKSYCRKNEIEADLFMAVESGIQNQLGGWMITNIAMIEDNQGIKSIGTSPSFPVPEHIVEEVIKTNLSQVMDRLFKKDEQRHNQGGGIQLLTHGEVSRIDLTRLGFIMALTEFINGEIWK